MIELIDFSKKYPHNKEYSVSNVNFQVCKGSITGLLGLNGSGKTTIIKAICGFHYPSKGSIHISDSNNKFYDTVEYPEKCMELTGYVPEISCLPPDMTVKYFLDYAARTHGLSDKESSFAQKTVINQFNLEKLTDKKIKNLSKGQQQRVSFAQALIHNPPNLVLDEPISGLDPAQIKQMREMIKALSKSKAILMSTHILQEVYELCDNLIIVKDGQIVASGTEENIIITAKTDNLENAFLKLTEKVED